MAKYVLRKSPARPGDTKEPGLHVRLLAGNVIRTERLAEKIAYSASFTSGEVEGLLKVLADRTAGHLSNGNPVELGCMSTLTPRLKASRPITDKNEIRAASVSFHNVHFRAKELLIRHLDEQLYITRTDYSDLTGRLKDRALTDLREFERQGIIERRGSGAALLFVKVQKKEE